MPKRRLTNLKVTEVSAVDSGAGRNVRVVLAKRAADGGDVTFVSKADGRRWTVPADSDFAMLAAEHAEELGVTVEGGVPTNEMEVTMPTVTKALAAMNKRVEQILKSGAAHSREAAIAVVASGRTATDQEIWADYRKAGASTGLETVSEPQPASSGEAYAALEKRARKYQKQHPGISDASAFSVVYTDPANREIVEAYKGDFAAQGRTVIKAEPVAPILSAYEIDQRERAAHIQKAAASGAELRERARQNNQRALAAMYPKWPASRIARLARQQAEGGIDLSAVAEGMGFRGGP